MQLPSANHLKLFERFFFFNKLPSGKFCGKLQPEHKRSQLWLSWQEHAIQRKFVKKSYLQSEQGQCIQIQGLVQWMFEAYGCENWLEIKNTE